MRTLFIYLTLLLCTSFKTFNSNIVVTGTLELPAGNYDSITMTDGSVLLIKTQAVIKNLNSNVPCTIEIFKSANVTFESSVNLNGGMKFYNHSGATIVKGSIELQGSVPNYFESDASIKCNEFQINNLESKMKLIGCETEFICDNFMNIRGNTGEASLILEHGARITTPGMNLDAHNVITGTGFIMVFKTFNLNAVITQSDNIYFYYPASTNIEGKLGKAKYAAFYKCPTLAVTYKGMNAGREKSGAIKVDWEVSDFDGSEEYRIEVSPDAINFYDAKTIKVDKLTPNKKHTEIIADPAPSKEKAIMSL